MKNDFIFEPMNSQGYFNIDHYFYYFTILPLDSTDKGLKNQFLYFFSALLTRFTSLCLISILQFVSVHSCLDLRLKPQVTL